MPFVSSTLAPGVQSTATSPTVPGPGASFHAFEPVTPAAQPVVSPAPPSPLAAGPAHAPVASPMMAEPSSSPIAVPARSRAQAVPSRHQRQFQSQLARSDYGPMTFPQPNHIALFGAVGWPPTTISPMDAPPTFGREPSSYRGSIYDEDVNPGRPPEIENHRRREMLRRSAEELIMRNEEHLAKKR
jgi:hypothetical protein